MSLRFPALRWTTLLLAASIALTTIGVVEASRAVRSQRAVAEHALRDYAGFAAWSYQQHLQARLGRATEELVGAFNHGHDVHRGPNVPPVESMPHYIYIDRELQLPSAAVRAEPVRLPRLPHRHGHPRRRAQRAPGSARRLGGGPRRPDGDAERGCAALPARGAPVDQRHDHEAGPRAPRDRPLPGDRRDARTASDASSPTR